MVNRVHRITWSSGVTEYVEFDPASPPEPGEITETFEYRGKKTVDYKVKVGKFSTHPDGRYTLELRYLKEVNQNFLGDLITGTSMITGLEDSTEGSAFFTEDSNQENFTGPAECFEVWDESKSSAIDYETVKRIRRLQKFRSSLLDHVKYCELSGETTLAVLQAAHINPVADSTLSVTKRDSVANGILLRSDLHLLFDDGIFWIREDGSVEVNAEKDLSDHYRNFLESARLSTATLERISPSLARANAGRRKPA